MAGLVLGLLVGSATASYNTQRSELLTAASNVILLDRVLAHYGPQAAGARAVLRASVQQTLDKMWPQEASRAPQIVPTATHAEDVLDKLEELTPGTDSQRSLKPEAIGLAISIAQTRWLMYEQGGSGLSVPLLVLLIFWFTITFVGFGIFSPSNPTVFVALGLSALAVSGAIVITLAMYMPFEGLMQLSSRPLREALALLGH
ncbi:MAG TPA: hypothetical protein VFF63_00155 [Candidatus Babeliales bacterium]|nr:hypothetical protein [Candidatus Babeliales bacterium]